MQKEINNGTLFNLLKHVLVFVLLMGLHTLFLYAFTILTQNAYRPIGWSLVLITIPLIALPIVWDYGMYLILKNILPMIHPIQMFIHTALLMWTVARSTQTTLRHMYLQILKYNNMLKSSGIAENLINLEKTLCIFIVGLFTFGAYSLILLKSLEQTDMQKKYRGITVSVSTAILIGFVSLVVLNCVIM